MLNVSSFFALSMCVYPYEKAAGCVHCKDLSFLPTKKWNKSARKGVNTEKYTNESVNRLASG